jgi:hypothetical protein
MRPNYPHVTPRFVRPNMYTRAHATPLVSVSDCISVCNRRHVDVRLLLPRNVGIRCSRALAYHVLALIFFRDLWLRPVHSQVVGRALLPPKIRRCRLETRVVRFRRNSVFV